MDEMFKDGNPRIHQQSLKLCYSENPGNYLHKAKSCSSLYAICSALSFLCKSRKCWISATTFQI